MPQNQNKRNNEKGIFLLLILLCRIKREAKNFIAVLLKMAFACMCCFWKFPHAMPLKMRSFLLLTIQNSKPLWPSCFQNSVVVKNVCVTDAHYELRLTLKLMGCVNSFDTWTKCTSTKNGVTVNNQHVIVSGSRNLVWVDILRQIGWILK